MIIQSPETLENSTTEEYFLQQTSSTSKMLLQSIPAINEAYYYDWNISKNKPDSDNYMANHNLKSNDALNYDYNSSLSHRQTFAFASPSPAINNVSLRYSKSDVFLPSSELPRPYPTENVSQSQYYFSQMVNPNQLTNNSMTNNDYSYENSSAVTTAYEVLAKRAFRKELGSNNNRPNHNISKYLDSSHIYSTFMPPYVKNRKPPSYEESIRNMVFKKINPINCVYSFKNL